MDYRHEQFDPPEGDIDRGPWQVDFPLDVSDKAAFQHAAPGVVPAERKQFHSAPEPTGYISPWWQSKSIGAHLGAEAHELHTALAVGDRLA